MDQSRRFAPIDLVVMQETNRILSMMDECLSGRVKDVFTLLYDKPALPQSTLAELKNNNFYNMNKNTNDDGKGIKSISCGFFMRDNEYPSIKVAYGIGNSFHDFNNELDRMKVFVINHDEWKKVDPVDAKDWAKWQGDAGVYCRKSLVEFLQPAYDDHISAIEEYFVEKLNELKSLVGKFK